MSDFFSQPPTPSSPAPGPFSPGQRFSPRLWNRLLFRASQWYAFLFLGRDIGLSLGVVYGDLNDRILRGSVPNYEPTTEMLGPARNTVYDSNPSEILGRANRWSAVLESRIISGDLTVPARTVLTTYGFVSFRRGIRLSVIHYVAPSAIFGLRHRPAPARISDHIFPVIIRPASFVPMATRSRRRLLPSLRGNIWLKIIYNKSAKLGYLTAHHAIDRSRIGAMVAPDTYRSPPAGVLVHRSEAMDCAVVRTDFDLGLAFKTVHPSSVIGYKPVRLITGERDIDAKVVEHGGHVQGVMWRGSGRKDPRESAVVFVNRQLSKGHSGCLVVDCEPEQYDMRAVPYAMYQGAWQGIMPGLGCCQLLEQVRQQWNLEFCEPWEDEDERKPKIS